MNNMPKAEKKEEKVDFFLPSIISCFLTSLGQKGASILNQNSGNRTKFAISCKRKGNPVIN
jgi:hypothetical protein